MIQRVVKRSLIHMKETLIRTLLNVNLSVLSITFSPY